MAAKKSTAPTGATSPSSAAPLGARVALLPARVDVLLIACSAADKAAVVELIRKAATDMPDECIEGIVDAVVRSPPVGAANLPIEDAKALIRGLDAIGVDACIELTASWLPEQQERPPLAGIAEGSALLLEAVDDQRAKLYNVESTLRCVADALEADQNSAGGAIELIADEVERVNVALDRVNLLKAAQEGAAAVEEVRAASEAARETRS
jgi:hypothetical protein